MSKSSSDDIATSPADFVAFVEQHRAELQAYCYRLLGSVSDADDALQEALIGAWRGLASFEGRSSLRSWVYRVVTNACLRLIEGRKRRLLPEEYGAATTGVDVDAMMEGPHWLEPYPTAADASYELRESLELSFVAALQHLPGTQRAALVLREALGFSAAEVAELLDTSVASVNSALQRARESVQQRVPPMSQQATLKSLGEEGARELTSAFVRAWDQGDVTSIVSLLTSDAKFTMPPIPTWFFGQESIARFLSERVFATAWRLVPHVASGQLAFACYQGPDFRLGALNVVTLRDRSISAMTGFLDPAVHARFALPEQFPVPDR